MINCTVYGYDDETFSYKLYKNPASSPFNLRKGVLGFFVNDNIFNVSIEKGSLLEIENLSDLQTWNVESLFSHSATTITTIFSEMLRSAIRKRADDAVYTKRFYSITFVPCNINPKIELVASLCEVEVIEDKLASIITFSSDQYDLLEFLQRVFICMFINFEGFRFAQKEQIAMFVKFVTSWNSENAEEITNFLTGKRTSLLTVASENGIELTERETLHEWKHKTIGTVLKENELFADTMFVELGCGTGQFVGATKVNKNKYLGVELDSYKVNKASRKYSKYTFIEGDIFELSQNVISATTGGTLLLLEVIEHFEKEQLGNLVMNIDHVYKPKYIVLTTPNRSANLPLYGLEGLRHSEHKFEFDELEYAEFLMTFQNYEIMSVDVDTSIKNGTDIRPSFVTFLSRKEDDYIDNRIVSAYYDNLKLSSIRFGKLVAPLYLPNIDYTFEPNQIGDGLDTNHYKKTSPFYLGSSIAPADTKDASGAIGDSVEHPAYAVEYYRNHGYGGDFIYQVKQMGSRANILAFRTIGIANYYGYDKLVTITSRRGYQFFRKEEDSELYSNQVHSDLFNTATNKYDVLMLDCEITPWQFLAKGLIDEEFRQPVLLQLNGGRYDKFIKQSAGIEAEFDEYGCIDFLESLDLFTPDEPLRCHVFDILLAINNNGTNIEYGYETDYYKKMNTLALLLDEPTFLTRIAYFTSSYSAWKYAIDNNKEGIVVKPVLPFVGNGRLIQPAIKARTPQFLRLIYGGPSYDEYAHLIKNRNVKGKRSVAIKEAALSMLMVSAVAKRDVTTKNRAVAAFFGIKAKVDGTL